MEYQCTSGQRRAGEPRTFRRPSAYENTIVSGSLTCGNPLTKLDLGQLARLFFAKHGRFLARLEA